jgi:hypothetical protein
MLVQVSAVTDLWYVQLRHVQETNGKRMQPPQATRMRLTAGRKMMDGIARVPRAKLA